MNGETRKKLKEQVSEGRKKANPVDPRKVDIPPFIIRKIPAHYNQNGGLIPAREQIQYTKTKHGTESAYSHWNCRCYDCRIAANEARYVRYLRSKRKESAA